MKTVYICSPYRADNRAQLHRNIEYARELTKQAIEVGLAPITPHLYMTQCLNEDKPEERAAGIAAGVVLLQRCNCLIVGNKYGISEGMTAQIATAKVARIKKVTASELQDWMEVDRRAQLEEYANLHACKFCRGSRMHTCTRYSCKEPYKKAYEYAEKNLKDILWENFLKNK